MTRWQYRVRPTNLDEYEQWRDVFQTGYPIGVMYCDGLQFRRRPRRSLTSVVAAISRRAGKDQQRGGEAR